MTLQVKSCGYCELQEIVRKNSAYMVRLRQIVPVRGDAQDSPCS